MPRFLATLARVNAMSERGVPNWLSTHPDPGSRVTKAEPVAGKFVSADAKKVNHDQYLERIQGLVFGDNPKDGVVRGNEFLHPLLRIGVKFPEGWELTNTPDAVMAQEPGTRALHGAAGSRAAARGPIDRRRRGRRRCARPATPWSTAACRRSTGSDAHVGLYRGNAKGAGKVMMRAAHIAVGRQLYVVAGFAPEAEFALVDRDIQPSVQTFRQLTMQEASNVRPNRLDFYVVRQGDSWQSIAARQSKGFVNAATLAIMNDREVSAQPQPGDRVKIVIEG